MSAFTLNIKGQLNSMILSESKSLWPLFEAVVNSIHAIEDSPNSEQGKISIYAQRDELIQGMLDHKNVLGRIESFQITDNGVGFNDDNYLSFNTAYSTFKIKKGCKGIGRFLWLKAFNSVEISSIYQENDNCFRREFTFSPDGVKPEKNNTKIDMQDLKTSIILKAFNLPYKNNCPVELDVLAKKIIEHCLLFFISGKCPVITIDDGYSESINLNKYFDANIKDSLHQDHFRIKDDYFVLYHLKVPEGANSHGLHLCANKQEVTTLELKNYIPDLQKKIFPDNDPIGFYYLGYVTSKYLDDIVNTTRTGFDYDEEGTQISLTGTGKGTLVTSALEFVNLYLAEYISDIRKNKKSRIDNFVANDRPTYRYMLNKRPDVYDKIPAGLKDDSLELELHKELQLWETEVKIQAQKLDMAIKNGDCNLSEYQELFDNYWTSITEVSKTYLAEYVTRRKTLLTILENTLTIQDNGRFKKEDAIHSIICPMRHTSDDIDFEEMNLWIIDERLAYHKFLASDKTIKSLPSIDSKSTKELDIAIFDRAFAFSEDDAPLNTITIVEFKKPDNVKDNPLSQIGKYIDEIISGQKKRTNGLSFGANSKTSFRCYAICDMSQKMEAHCKDAGLRMTPDGMGYYGYQPERNAYYEVITYPKLLADAKKRNSILFEKLFNPKMSKVINLVDILDTEKKLSELRLFIDSCEKEPGVRSST